MDEQDNARRWQEHQEAHARQDADYRLVRDTLVEIRLSLENGRKSFEKNEARLSKLEPKPKSWVELLLGAAAALLIVGGTVWTLAMLFSARPTFDTVQQAIDQHAATPSHPDTQTTLKELQGTVGAVQRDQAALRASQEDTHSDVAEMKGDLKTLLRRK